MGRFYEERDGIIKEGGLSRWLKQQEAGETLIQHLLWPELHTGLTRNALTQRSAAKRYGPWGQ